MSQTSSDPSRPTTGLEVEAMIDLIERWPSDLWPNGWAFWPNVCEAHRRMSDRFLEALPGDPADQGDGRGLVVPAGGSYFAAAWVALRRLRELGCELPIELWHLGPSELDGPRRKLLESLGVETVDAFERSRVDPCRILRGWELKPYAMLHSRFREVLLLDADNVPLRDPTFLFEEPEYRSQGAVLWPDFYEPGSDDIRHHLGAEVWAAFGLGDRDEPPVESAQILVDKGRCWWALNLTLWYVAHSDWSFRHVWGDKDCFHVAWRRCGSGYASPSHPPIWAGRTMIQHDFQGSPLFQHHCLDKWRIPANGLPDPSWIDGEACLAALRDLDPSLR